MVQIIHKYCFSSSFSFSSFWNKKWGMRCCGPLSLEWRPVKAGRSACPLTALPQGSHVQGPLHREGLDMDGLIIWWTNRNWGVGVWLIGPVFTASPEGCILSLPSLLHPTSLLFFSLSSFILSDMSGDIFLCHRLPDTRFDFTKTHRGRPSNPWLKTEKLRLSEPFLIQVALLRHCVTKTKADCYTTSQGRCFWKCLCRKQR